MKKARSSDSDELRAEYDFSALGPGVRGKYAKRLAGKTLVALQPEVAKAFPTADAVNEALLAVLKATSVVRRAPPVARRASGRRPRSRKS
jgi:hypothetical protein